MTLPRSLRPVLAMVALSALGGCGGAEGDSGRFERWAERVADIPVSLDRPGARREASVEADPGLRPARPPVRVEVMEPMAFWDARDGLAGRAAQAVVETAAPVVVEAAVREVETRVTTRAGAAMRHEPESGLRPARIERPRIVQIGAFSSEAAARRAWAALGEDRTLAALTPVYEAVDVGGRRLVRLKVAAPAHAARAVCAAAGVRDPWCSRQG